MVFGQLALRQPSVKEWDEGTIVTWYYSEGHLTIGKFNKITSDAFNFADVW